jgi:hypothetical protein
MLTGTLISSSSSPPLRLMRTRSIGLIPVIDNGTSNDRVFFSRGRTDVLKLICDSFGFFEIRSHVTRAHELVQISNAHVDFFWKIDWRTFQPNGTTVLL